MPCGITQLQLEKAHAESEKATASHEILAERAARGDGGALYELCEKIAKDVLFRATHIMGNRTDAEDVTQEVLLRVCTKIHNLRDPKIFGVWLGKIVVNEAKRHMVENARRGVVLNIDDYLEAIMEEKDDFLPQECAENGESRRAVMEAVASLPMRQREAVIFHYYDGLSVTEAAEAMGVTKPSVSRYLALAREKIKREMECRELGTGKPGMFAAVPLLPEILRHEAQRFAPPGDAWMQQTLARCKAYIDAASASAASASAAPASAAAKAPFGLLMGSFATVFTATALITGIALSDPPRSEVAEVSIDGTVFFYGDAENDGNTIYVNPDRAEVSADSTGGETRIVNWWITGAGSDTVLHEGSESELGDVLIKMRESGTDGKYMIYFRLVDEAGAVHKLGRSFYILTSE